MQCPLCEAAFRASSQGLLQRILDEHVGKAHGMPVRDTVQALDTRPDGA
jgi:uncharacterized C2H2 Zn-finger protein